MISCVPKVTSFGFGLISDGGDVAEGARFSKSVLKFKVLRTVAVLQSATQTRLVSQIAITKKP